MFPRFLCIGAQKAGTSWLNHNLRAHPGLWLPPRKELHYFDRLDQTWLQRLLLLRNPMERAWSSLNMKASMGRCPPMGSMDKQQLVHRLTTGRVPADGDYLGNLARWQRHFPERQIMVGFFDEIMADPEPFLRRVYRFLEVDDAAKYVPADVRQARNARPSRGRIREDIHYPLTAA